MSCGLCGGGVRLYSGTLHGRPIRDWKHTSAPPGTAPHRPVLGTPVDAESLERIRQGNRNALAVKQAKKTAVVKVADPPAVPLRPATAEEVNQSARQVHELAELHWWTAEPLQYCRTAEGVEWLVFRARRADLGAVAVWERRAWTKSKATWGTDGAFTVAGRYVEQVSSEQLKSWLTQRHEVCPDCGASSVTHEQGECP